MSFARLQGEEFASTLHYIILAHVRNQRVHFVCMYIIVKLKATNVLAS